MIREIQSLPISHTDSEIGPIFSKYKQSAENFQYSTLTQENFGFILKLWASFRKGCSSVYYALKAFLPCCCLGESIQSRQLSDLRKQWSNHSQRLKDGTISRNALKRLWRNQFDQLEISTRELLLLEYVKLYAPNISEEQQWAKSNLEKYRIKAVDYIANLYVQRERGVDKDPIEELSIFIDNVIKILEGSS